MSTPAAGVQEWRDVPWPQVERDVHTLQRRIYRASQRGDRKKVHRLQRLLMSSWSAKCLAVRRVTQDNQGKRTAGVDGIAYLRPEERLTLVSALDLDAKPKPTRRVWIPKPGTDEKRPRGIPSVRDRVVQTALRNVLEPIFECDFAETSYGFRPGRSCQQAVARVEELLEAGHIWCVDCDLKSYFDTIPQDRLMALIQQRVVDGKVLRLVAAYFKAGVMEDLKGWQPTERGTPQGAVISPLLANIYLNPLDHALAKGGWEIVRYADDFVVLCRTEAEAQAVLDYLRQWTSAAGLTLHPLKTRVVNASIEGFDFLGWTFRGGKKWPRKKSLHKLRDKLRPLTRRTNGLSLGAIVAKANPILRGWRAYFKDSHRNGLNGPDGWLRRRLRAMLRKRQKRPGYGLSKADSQQWPNRWFAAHGLYSLLHGTCAYA